MWSSDETDVSATEALIRDAAWMPQPTTVFRARVLSTVAKEQRQSRRSERLKVLTTLALAATVLWCLPGWLPTTSVSTSGSPAATMEASESVLSARGLSLMDDYEWGLVQAALAKKSHSAVLIQGLL
jgi:hypothetical protein